VIVSTDMAPVLTGNGYLFKDETMNSYGQCRVYLLAKENCDLRQKEKAVNDFLAERIWLFKKSSVFPSKLQFHPLPEMYFMERKYGSETSQGNRQLSLLLSMTGLVILLFAMLNYINLTMAQSTFRMREGYETTAGLAAQRSLRPTYQRKHAVLFAVARHSCRSGLCC